MSSVGTDDTQSETLEESGTYQPEDTERDQSIDDRMTSIDGSLPTPTAQTASVMPLPFDWNLPAASVTSEPRDDADPEITQQDREKQFASLLANMNETELDRYEAYRRSCLPRSKMKKLLASLSHLPIHDDKTLIVICSLAKMFVGQIVQESRSQAASMGECGALRPEHVRQAFKKLESGGSTFRRCPRRAPFRR